MRKFDVWGLMYKLIIAIHVLMQLLHKFALSFLEAYKLIIVACYLKRSLIVSQALLILLVVVLNKTNLPC